MFIIAFLKDLFTNHDENRVPFNNEVRAMLTDYGVSAEREPRLTLRQSATATIALPQQPDNKPFRIRKVSALQRARLESVSKEHLEWRPFRSDYKQGGC